MTPAKSTAKLAALAALVLGLAACDAPAGQAGRNRPTIAGETRVEGVVLSVVDGDTLHLAIGESRETVRLIGINTPETKHPTKGVECFGPEASAFLTRLLPPGTRVRIERDAEARDAYRRLLLYVFLPAEDGERFVNLEIVARGYAVPLSIEPNTRYQQYFVELSFDAQQNSRGLWGACK